MSIATTPPPSSPSNRFTAADLQALPDEKNYELVDGKFEERHRGVLSSLVAAKLMVLLGTFCQRMNLGAVEELSGEDVIPGFRCQLSELFALPAGVV